MLEPGNRRLLLDSLRPPQGYRLDQAVGTSYSLDLIALLTAPLAFTFFDAEDVEGHPTREPLALLEAARRYSRKISLFVHASRIQVPPKGQPLLALLEDSVIPVLPSVAGAVFHPKVWVLRFTAAQGPVLYRLVCLSRNLTFDRSWDTALVLDGEFTPRHNPIVANQPLADFLEALPDLALRPLGEDRRATVSEFVDEIRRVRFELPDGFSDYAFRPLGIRGYERWHLPESSRPALVLSPFITGEFLSALADKRERTVLISRAEELERAPRSALELYDEIYALHDAAQGDPPEIDDEDEGPTERPLAGLHAKVFVIEEGWHAHLWTGSANATTAAFNGNVEFLVELTGLRSRIGIDALIGESQPDGGSGLRLLLERFEPAGAAVERDADAELLERRLDEAREILGRAQFRARVHSVGEDSFDVELSADRLESDLPPDVRAWCWPASVGRAHRAPVGVDAPTASFRGLSLGDLSAFFTFELEARHGGRREWARLVLAAALEGVPADRHERLIISLLDDPDRVRQLLWLLLAAGDVSAAELSERLAGTWGAGGLRASRGEHMPLLEAMLRALAEEPSRLDDVAQLIQELGRTPTGRAVLPADLDAAWKAIWEVREAARS